MNEDIIKKRNDDALENRLKILRDGLNFDYTKYEEGNSTTTTSYVGNSSILAKKFMKGDDSKIQSEPE